MTNSIKEEKVRKMLRNNCLPKKNVINGFLSFLKFFLLPFLLFLSFFCWKKEKGKSFLLSEKNREEVLFRWWKFAISCIFTHPGLNLKTVNEIELKSFFCNQFSYYLKTKYLKFSNSDWITFNIQHRFKPQKPQI